MNMIYFLRLIWKCSQKKKKDAHTFGNRALSLPAEIWGLLICRSKSEWMHLKDVGNRSQGMPIDSTGNLVSWHSSLVIMLLSSTLPCAALIQNFLRHDSWNTLDLAGLLFLWCAFVQQLTYVGRQLSRLWTKSTLRSSDIRGEIKIPALMRVRNVQEHYRKWLPT